MEQALQRLLASQDPEPIMSSEPNVEYKQTFDPEQAPIEVDAPVVEPVPAPTYSRGYIGHTDIEAHPKSQPLFAGMDPQLKEALIGLIPFGIGVATGNTSAGVDASKTLLDKIDTQSRENAKANSASSIKKAIEAARLQRELMKNQRAEAQAKRMTKANTAEVVGPDGKTPVIAGIEDAVGKQPYHVPAKGSMSEEEWARREAEKLKNAKDLADFKNKLKGKQDKKMSDYEGAKSEDSLARMYAQDSKHTQEMGQAYLRFGDLLKNPASGARDISAIFQYMKILDPGSTVREGEQATAANAGSIPDSVYNMYNRVLLGKDQKLPEGLAEKFYDQATALYNGQLQFQSKIDGHYHSTANRRGLDSRNIIRPHAGVNKMPSAKGPKTINYKNKEGKVLPMDPSKLTPRMKADLAKDGFSPETK